MGRTKIADETSAAKRSRCRGEESAGMPRETCVRDGRLCPPPLGLEAQNTPIRRCNLPNAALIMHSVLEFPHGGKRLALIEGGKWIICNGPVCDARIRAVVALRPSFSVDTEALIPTAGWLFVLRDDLACHFCPVCAPQYLKSLSQI